MAWYNPATWTPVDKVQNLVSGGANAAMDYARTGKVNTGGSGILGGGTGNAVQNYARPGQQSRPAAKPQNSGAAGASQPAWTPVQAGGGGGGGGYDSAGGSSAPSYNPADLAYLDDQQSRLERQLGRTNTYLTQGLAELMDSYNKSRTSANQQRGRELENLGLQREDTTRKKDSTLDRVNTGARTLADSLRRKIGMASGSGSSAYQIAAPGAVARQASEQRGDVMEDFGTNFRNLDLTERRANEDYNTLFESLESDKKSRERALRQGIEEQRLGIDQSLAELARQRALVKGGGYDQVKQAMSKYTDRMTDREKTIDSLFNKYRSVGKFQPVKVNAPQLRDYTVDKAAIQANQQAGTNDPYAPYRPQLMDDEEQFLV